MLKNRLNLRKVTTIVACLAVTTAFCGCGNGGGDDDNGSNSDGIDKKLVGLWHHRQAKPNYVWVTWIYYFSNDGKFSLIEDEKTVEGKYRVANGKVYFTNMIWRPNEEYSEKISDTTVEYKFDKEDGKEVLKIPRCDYDDIDYLDIDWAEIWYRQGTGN